MISIGFLGGCAEFVHEGQVNDRLHAHSVNDVKVEQLRPDGTWKTLGRTDGRGMWWILKSKVSGGGKIRFSKPGYAPFIVPESEFLETTTFLIQPHDDSGGFGRGGYIDPFR